MPPQAVHARPPLVGQRVISGIEIAEHRVRTTTGWQHHRFEEALFAGRRQEAVVGVPWQGTTAGHPALVALFVELVRYRHDLVMLEADALVHVARRGNGAEVVGEARELSRGRLLLPA